MVTEVCGCHNVSDTEIEALLDMEGHGGRPEGTLTMCKDALQCGTGCGGCIPHIEEVISVHKAKQ